MSGHNTTADYLSAPLPPSGLPQAQDEITPANNIPTMKHEKDLIMGPGALARDSVTVNGANDLTDEDVEPTDEEYATLRK